ALYIFQNEKFTRYTTKDGLSGNIIRDFWETRDGKMWIGTDNGLTLWNDGRFTTFTATNGFVNNAVAALYQDADDTLWIGTIGAGLQRYRDGKFTGYRAKQGLFADQVYDIVEDNDQYLWMCCLRGIFCVKKSDFEDLDRGKIKSLNCASYGKNDGMATVQCSGVGK